MTLAGAFLCALVAGAPATAQQGGRVVLPDTVTPPDSLAQVDSTRIRQLRLLQDLARAPGADSARLAEDSARVARPQPGGQPRQLITAQGDSILEELLALDGYVATEYAGREAEYLARDGILFLKGDSTNRASFRGSDGLQVSVDSVIEYEQETGIMRTQGDVLSIPPDGDEVQSRYLICDTNLEECQALSARTQYSEGADWYVTSDLIARPEVSFGHSAMFTSCDEEEPHYHFATSQLKIVNGSLLVARDVRLYFADVPVAWLPFIAQSLGSGRASGILTPTFSVNDIVRTSGGYRRRVSNVGYYWAMNDYMDALVAMDWWDDNYTAITGSYRYTWARQFLRGDLSFRQFWRAEGGSELTLDTQHSWDLSERTSFRMSARYASSAAFVSRNSFNPQEITQSIDSEGGLSRRFDWGNLSVNGNRRQFLNDDRVETTFPSVNLSLKTITLFPAPANRARFWNNLTWSGGGRFTRSTTDRAPGLFYTPGQEDRANLNGGINTSVNLGPLSVGGSVSYQRGTTFGLREEVDTTALPFFVADNGMAGLFTPAGQAMLARQQTGDPVEYGDPFDVSEETLNWSSSINYQQNLIGSTTFTPRVTFSGNSVRGDQREGAEDQFVAAPVRTSFGATLRTDLYGFFPGVAGFERIRHKVSPSFTYDYAPEVTPTPIQVQVFGSRVQQPRNVMSVNLNQTFEAKRSSAADTATAPEPLAPDAPRGEPRRLPQAEIVNLLSLRTSAVRYDFVEADSLGFLGGFQTLQLSNQISSDLLRGLAISMTHDLFEESVPDGAGTGTAPTREFKPKLTQMNLGFSLNGQSAIFRLLGFGRDRGDEADEETEGEDGAEEDFAADDPLDPLYSRRLDENSMVPVAGRRNQQERVGGGRDQGIGEWSAQLSYALSRPRAESAVQSQMIQASVRLKPTQMWDLSWRTSYDLEQGGFNDHAIRLSRDLHRWRANFDFLQTATGNWSFRFEVSLLDNQDLKFDYQQRQENRLGR